jgi:hypothetical protein
MIQQLRIYEIFDHNKAAREIEPTRRAVTVRR